MTALSIFGSSRRPASLAERCDRRDCINQALVRVTKYVAELRELDGQPHAVDRRPMDLVFCGMDFHVFQLGLERQGFLVLEDCR